MKQIALLTLFFIISIFSVFAQTDLRQEGEAINSQYPTIKFRINHFDPETKTKDAFKLFENGNEIEFTVRSIAADKDEIHKNKTILFLFEDMSPTTHPEQKIFFQQLLSISLGAFVNDGDGVNVAVFNRSTNGSSPIRKMLLQNYTDDKELLKSKISNFESQYDVWASQKSSDLYQSIFDGINQLLKMDSNTGKILVVLSAGFNNPESSENSTARVISLATKNRIPIYNIQYYYQGWEHHKLTTLVNESKGLEFIASHSNKEKDLRIAADSLAFFMNNALLRLHGNDYEFTFKTSEEKDTKLHAVQLKEGNRVSDIVFYTPTPSLMDIATKHSVLVLGIFIIIITIVVAIVITIKRNKWNALKKEKDQQEKVEQLRLDAERVAKEQKERAEADRMKMEDLQQVVEEQRRKAEELQRKTDDEKRKRLEQLQSENYQRQLEETVREMQIKGFPRLIISTREGNKTLTITNPETTLGRNSDNMIALEEQSVSRNHAKITYSAGNYFIEDLGSSNGTFINGRKVKKQLLNNADVIQLGQQQISFFYSR